MYKRKLLLFKWLQNVVDILNETGFSHIFHEQFSFDDKYLKNVLLPKIKIRIKDQAVQALFEKINSEEDKFFFYNELITFHGIQKCLKKCPLISGYH